MEGIKNNLLYSFKYVKTFVKWLLVSSLVGVFGGLIGSSFHMGVEYVTEFRLRHSWIVFFLPVGGVLIAGLYRLFRKQGKIDTNRVFEAIKSDEKVPIVMVPLIFISTVITHLVGGSAGREGAALQLGGSIGYNFGKLFHLSKNDLHLIVMAGMSSVFAALFGTPLTATIFALEVVSVGVIHYAGLLPCIISSVIAYRISLALGISPVCFDSVMMQSFTFTSAGKVIILGILCALVGIGFCTAIKKSEHYMDKLIPNAFLQTLVGSALLLLLTFPFGNWDYHGAGMNIITRAIGGEARPEAFLLKIIFTAITIAAGFKGGEIVPTFFIGSTFGCVMGGLLGLDPGFGAAIGFVALFCSVVNCPLASVVLSLEIFGSEGLLFFAIACSVSYMMSGPFSLYGSQTILYSKLDDKLIDVQNK